MATNYTTNYDLCQWESTDQVLRVEFNADNAKLDAALKSLSNQVIQKAEQSALNTIISAVNQKADAATVSSLSSQLSNEIAQRQEADSSMQAILAKKGNCRIYFTSYTGSGTKTHSHTFPSPPIAVLISGPSFQLITLRGNTSAYSMEGGNPWWLVLTWSDSTVTIAYTDTLGGGDSKAGNEKGLVYSLLALMDGEE